MLVKRGHFCLMPLALSVPIFNKKSHQARAAEKCLKQKFPIFTTTKIEIFVSSINKHLQTLFYYEFIGKENNFQKKMF